MRGQEQLPDRLDLDDNPGHRALVASGLNKLAIIFYELGREHTGEGHRKQHTVGSEILRAVIPKTDSLRSSVERDGKFVSVAKELARVHITNYEGIEEQLARQWKITNAIAELALTGNTVFVLLPHSEIIDTAVAGISIFSDMEDHGMFDEDKPHMTRGIIVSEMTNSFVVDFDKKNEPQPTSVQQGALPSVDDMLGLIFNRIYKSCPTDTESMTKLWEDLELAYIMRSINTRTVEKLQQAIHVGNLTLLVSPSACQDRASADDPSTIRMHGISDGTTRLLVNQTGQEKKKYVVGLAFRIDNENGNHTAKYLDMPQALNGPRQVHRMWHKMARTLTEEQTGQTKLKFKYDGPRWWQKFPRLSHQSGRKK